MDLEDLLRNTFHARADQAPPGHHVLAGTEVGTAHRAARRVRRFSVAATVVAVTVAVIVGFGLSQQGRTPTAVDVSTGSAAQTTPTPTPTQGSLRTPRPATLALNEYVNAVTELIVQCLQDKGFAVVMNKNSQMTDGAGRDQLTYRASPALQDDPAYRTARDDCSTAAEAAVGPAPS